MKKYFNNLTKNIILSIVLLSFFLVILDQVTKIVAIHYLVKEYNSVEVLPFFNFILVYNRGVSFSFLYGLHWGVILVMSSVSFILAFVLLLGVFKTLGKIEIIALSLLVSGSLGNIIDRIVYKYVVDFLHVYYSKWSFPVFNIADCMITLCAIIVIYKILFSGNQNV